MKDTKALQNTLPLLAVGLIVIAALSRILPHPHNFTPIGGMALFAGAVFQRQRFSWLLPFVALWLSDLVLNNTIYSHYYTGFQWIGNYGVIFAFIAIFLIGKFNIASWKPAKLLGLSLLSSVVFFLMTNFYAWVGPFSIYAQDLTGLLTCYTAAIPFFGGTLIGDLFYNTVLFGGWYLITQKANHPQVAY